jgi:hypothetical protein
MRANIKKIWILISLLAIALTILIWTRTSSLRNENLRLQNNLRQLSQQVANLQEPVSLQVPTEDGKLAAQTAVMNLRLRELTALYPRLVSEIRNLDVRPERTVQVTNHYTENEKLITTLVRDSIIHDTIQVRVFHYQDGYYTVEGMLEGDTQRVQINSRDTLTQVVFRGKREKPWLWIFSPRPLQQRVAWKNPNAKIEYSQLIQLDKQ